MERTTGPETKQQFIYRVNQELMAISSMLSNNSRLQDLVGALQSTIDNLAGAAQGKSFVTECLDSYASRKFQLSLASLLPDEKLRLAELQDLSIKLSRYIDSL